jgi:hypothetical protein
MAGRPAHKGEMKPFQVSLPLRLYEYLGFLASQNVLGASESDVASYLLTARLIDLAERKFHELAMPTLKSAD